MAPALCLPASAHCQGEKQWRRWNYATHTSRESFRDAFINRAACVQAPGAARYALAQPGNLAVRCLRDAIGGERGGAGAEERE